MGEISGKEGIRMGEISGIEILPETVEVGLFLSGSAASRNVVYTCEQLEELEKPLTLLFSVYDDHENRESRKIEEGRGVPLADFLEDAGIREAEEIRAKSVDGFESVVTEPQSGRYYFPGLAEGDGAGAQPREALVSFYKNGEKVKDYPHPTIMFGQQDPEDKNKDFFAKGVRSVIAGGRDRAFWVKGDAVVRSRWFSMDQLFELGDAGTYRAARARLLLSDGSGRTTYAARIPSDFWEREIERRGAAACASGSTRYHGNARGIERRGAAACASGSTRYHGNAREIERRGADAPAVAVDADGKTAEISMESDLWLFFADETGKTLGLYDGSQIVERFAGFRIGGTGGAEKQRKTRVPSRKTEAGDCCVRVSAGIGKMEKQDDEPAEDFYVRVSARQKELARYDFTLEELRRDYPEAAATEEYCYYNHNMDGGKGGMRLVTARGWMLADLLEFLPEVPEREFLESGAFLFRVFTRDTYKEKIALDSSELTAYRFILAHEHDQRTETGREEGDTSGWSDERKRFEPIRGSTPYRIYCKKRSAGPAVYKNVEGIGVELL